MIDTGIVLLGMDVADWLLNVAVSLISLVMGIRVGRLRERHAKKQIELTEFERAIREQEARVDATDRDINRRVADLDNIDQRRTSQLDGIVGLENEILDCKNTQSKASTRMAEAARKLTEAKTALDAIEKERDAMADMLDRTRESRRLGRRDLRGLLEGPGKK